MSIRIQGKDILLGYSRTKILNPLPFDFEISKGETVALMGRNGSGKSTLLRAILGEPSLFGGTLFIDGRSVTKTSAVELSRKLAFVPQEPIGLVPTRVEDYLKLAFLPRMGTWGKLPSEAISKIENFLKSVDLLKLKAHWLEELSSGQRQQIVLGRALLQETEILILDEPTNHLDQEGVENFWKTLCEHGQTGKKTILVSTHDAQFSKNYADSVFTMTNGRIASVDKPSRA